MVEMQTKHGKICLFGSVVVLALTFHQTSFLNRGECVSHAEPPVEKGELLSMSEKLPDVHEVIASKTDLWGNAAMQEKNGASYEFLADLLPPLRYVNCLFRYYPIVLSAPGGLHKSRLLSNGSGINSLASIPYNWHEVGFPATIRVGDREGLFGTDLRRLDGPHYESGYLPIVQFEYVEGGVTYEQEVFAPVDPSLAEKGTVFLRMGAKKGNEGEVAVHIGQKGALVEKDNVLCSAEGYPLVWHDGSWRWENISRSLKTTAAECPRTLAIFGEVGPEVPSDALSPQVYEEHRQECVKTWETLLSKGMQVQVPETMVNNAWRSLVIGNYLLLRDDVMCYSAHNQYQKLYEAEGGEAVRSLLLWGFGGDVRAMIPPLLDYTRRGLEYHQAGLKLQHLAHYFWLTGDAEFVREQKDRWRPEVERILNDREAETGLFPREQYCGDIHDPVYALKSNTNCWRGLNDFAAVLREIGDLDGAEQLWKSAREFRKAIWAAVDKSADHDVSPPFIPNALFGEEGSYDVLTSCKLGSYWDLISPYIIESGALGREREQWMLETLQQHGGICMGMIRCRPNGWFWASKSNLDDLYGRRYTQTLLRNDEVEKALVSFYGKLAHGMTRDTFIGAEGTCLVPLDDFGRQMYLPPNSASNAFFLWMLRYLLVQDWDTSEDGKPDTLRLMFATPRRWLEDGKRIQVERAPTAFGEVGVTMESRLSEGEVVAQVQAPRLKPERTFLRARVPEGWEVVSATVEGQDYPVDRFGSVDISSSSGTFTVRFQTSRQ